MTKTNLDKFKDFLNFSMILTFIFFTLQVIGVAIILCTPQHWIIGSILIFANFVYLFIGLRLHIWWNHGEEEQ